jgi:hypothetical protein
MTSGVALPFLLMTTLTITRPERSHLSKKALSRVYVWVLLAFLFYVVSMFLYLWFYGKGAA